MLEPKKTLTEKIEVLRALNETILKWIDDEAIEDEIVNNEEVEQVVKEVTPKIDIFWVLTIRTRQMRKWTLQRSSERHHQASAWQN